MIWKIADFKKWIESGCPVNTEVTELRLDDNQLTSLPESIDNLRFLKFL